MLRMRSELESVLVVFIVSVSHVGQAKFCLRVCRVVFLGVLPFSPHLLIDSSNMSCNNLERDVKLNKKKNQSKNKKGECANYKKFR